MSDSEGLSKRRKGQKIRKISKMQELNLDRAIEGVSDYIHKRFKLIIETQRRILLREIVCNLRKNNPDVDFYCNFNETFMSPDGGIVNIVSSTGERLPILITEAKYQGTNKKRKKEGKQQQAKGNAIERLGKNLIGFKTAMINENIFPFICFGYGCDFVKKSTILDRVVTMSMFGKLNRVRVYNEGTKVIFNRGSFFFREHPWTKNEMTRYMRAVAKKSIYYYFSKHGKNFFNNTFKSKVIINAVLNFYKIAKLKFVYQNSKWNRVKRILIYLLNNDS